MAVLAVCGLPGKGKSWVLVYYALYLAEKHQRNVVCNFWLDLNKVAIYCRMMNYSWLLSQLPKGVINFIDANTNLSDLLVIRESIICLDEAGIFLFAREFAKTPRELLSALFQSRKYGQDILYACQYYSQVDVILRDLTEEVFYCNGTTSFDTKLRRDKLIIKNFHLFNVESFQQYKSDPKLKKNPIKTRLLATKSFTGMLSASEEYIFELYDSFTELEKQEISSNSNSQQNHVFNKLYYHSIQFNKKDKVNSNRIQLFETLQESLTDQDLADLGIQPQKVVSEFKADIDEITIYKSTGVTLVTVHKYSKFLKWAYKLLPYDVLKTLLYIDYELQKLIDFPSVKKLVSAPKVITEVEIEVVKSQPQEKEQKIDIDDLNNCLVKQPRKVANV